MVLGLLPLWEEVEGSYPFGCMSCRPFKGEKRQKKKKKGKTCTGKESGSLLVLVNLEHDLTCIHMVTVRR